MIGIFVAQLLLVSFFTHHKLLVLEKMFGLKDQRILATAAVSLISFTFVLIFLRLIKKISSTTIFKTQLIVLTSTMAILNIINVDLFLTRFYPIRYYYEEKAYKDYSYLLGNSYDNYKEWISLMHEAQQTGVPTPNNYYWGDYRAIRTKLAVNSTSTKGCQNKTYLREFYRSLINKYGSDKNKSLKMITKFNLNEWLAFKYYQEHEEIFETFYEYLETAI